MNIQQEIEKHLEWIETIASFLGEKEFTEQELHTISQHDKCELGTWLDSQASEEFKGSSELDEIKHSHETFHHLAGELISALQNGNETKAIELQGKFIGMSQEVISHLNLLQENGRK